MSRLLEINPSEILAAISKHHGLRSLARSTLLLLRRTKENLAHKLALSLRGNVSLPRLSLSRETTIAWMEKARKAGGLVRGNRGTGELAVYSIIVIYFSNTNSSERRLLSGFRNRSHTRVGEREREREIRERVESLDSLAFCFPSTRSTRVYTRPNETDKVR